MATYALIVIALTLVLSEYQYEKVIGFLTLGLIIYALFTT